MFDFFKKTVIGACPTRAKFPLALPAPPVPHFIFEGRRMVIFQMGCLWAFERLFVSNVLDLAERLESRPVLEPSAVRSRLASILPTGFEIRDVENGFFIRERSPDWPTANDLPFFVWVILDEKTAAER